MSDEIKPLLRYGLWGFIESYDGDEGLSRWIREATPTEVMLEAYDVMENRRDEVDELWLNRFYRKEINPTVWNDGFEQGKAKAAETIAKLTTQRDNLLEALKRLAAKEPEARDDEYDMEWCAYCDARTLDYNKRKVSITHMPDCPWLLAKDAIAEVESEIAKS